MRLRRWAASAILFPVALTGALVIDQPRQTARLDRAKLDFAAAIAADGRRAGGGHSARAGQRVAKVHASVDQTSRVDLALEQLRAFAHPPPRHPDPPLRWPAKGWVVSGYGPRAVPAFDRLHAGIDIINLPGTSVYAAADGIVARVGRYPVHGNLVVIDHGEQPQHPGSWVTIYGHLDELTVERHDHVRAGERIGTLGNSGERTTGPHLHFEVRIENQPVDPRRWLP
jgi:murein DD-endopeptidase MepM/ murein hydrolase activator NlpD